MIPISSHIRTNEGFIHPHSLFQLLNSYPLVLGVEELDLARAVFRGPEPGFAQEPCVACGPLQDGAGRLSVGRFDCG